jgi:hypothetical protein
MGPGVSGVAGEHHVPTMRSRRSGAPAIVRSIETVAPDVQGLGGSVAPRVPLAAPLSTPPSGRVST